MAEILEKEDEENKENMGNKRNKENKENKEDKENNGRIFFPLIPAPIRPSDARFSGSLAGGARIWINGYQTATLNLLTQQTPPGGGPIGGRDSRKVVRNRSKREGRNHGK